MNNNNLIQSAIQSAKTAAKQAVAQVRHTLGKSNDPDLMRYERLGPADFERMSAEYGPDEVARYVKAMEVRRMQGGQL